VDVAGEPRRTRSVSSGSESRSAAQDQPSTTRLVLLVNNEEQIHPEIVRDDLAAVLDSHGYDYEWISAEDVT
jgi:hypothetical protein